MKIHAIEKKNYTSTRNSLNGKNGERKTTRNATKITGVACNANRRTKRKPLGLHLRF